MLSMKSLMSQGVVGWWGYFCGALNVLLGVIIAQEKMVHSGHFFKTFVQFSYSNQNFVQATYQNIQNETEKK